MKNLKILIPIIFYLYWGFFQSCAKNPFPPEVKDVLAHQNRRTLGKVIEQYRQSPKVEIRSRLGLAIASSRDTLLIPELEILLKDSSPVVREAAILALGQMAGQRIENLLLRHLESESDLEVCQQTAVALAQVGSLSSLNRLLEMTGAETQAYSVQTLVYYFQRQIYNSASLHFAVSKLRNGNRSEARWAAIALSRIRVQNVMRELANDLQDALSYADIDTRIKIVACLVPLNFSGKTELWSQLLTDNDSRIRIEAARGLNHIPENASILSQVLNDSVSLVVVTALDNLPDSLKLTEKIKYDFKRLARHPSFAIKYALVKYLSRRGGLDNLKDFDLWPLSDNLLAAVAEGLTTWGQPVGLKLLDSLSRHNNRAISTPAYFGLMSVAEQLHQQHSIDFDQLSNFIIAGLESDDPVKIAIAASVMCESNGNYQRLIFRLYPPLKKYKNTEYTDAIVEILKTIAILQPPDALPFIQPLSNSRNFRIRDLAQQIMQDVYKTNRPEIVDDYRGSGRYSNLAMLKKYGLRPTVLLDTERGRIIIRLDGYYAPFTVDAFLSTVENGFYNGLTFHRVVPNFVVQGGDPRGDGWGGPGYTLLTECSPLGYTPGAVGMARSDFDTESSQFFITLTDQPHLNYKYTRFGEVVEGLDIAAQIEKGDRILAITVLK